MLDGGGRGHEEARPVGFGDKTLLDAYMPAVDEFARSRSRGGGSDARRPARGAA